MKQTFSTKLLTIGFGCIVAIQGWQFMPYATQAYIVNAIGDSPAAFWMFVIGVLAIGFAAGTEDKEE